MSEEIVPVGVRMLGGPFDGAEALLQPDVAAETATRVIEVKSEVYVLTRDEDGPILIHSSLRSPPSDDPDLTHARESHALLGSEMDETCPPGQHVWSPWQATKRAYIRRCDRCGISQPRLF
jgi:hypothetical protein